MEHEYTFTTQKNNEQPRNILVKRKTFIKILMTCIQQNTTKEIQK